MRGNSRSGFTLIELSIVLVIIGLIVGGVLVGQDLIQAAELRATIAQIQKYQTAVNAFRSKYGALPGDIVSTDAAAFGMQPRAGTLGEGDGDGYIEACSVDARPYRYLGCENVLFWRDLSFAGLIDGSFTTATDVLAINLTTAQIQLYLPRSKIGKGSFIFPLPGITSTISSASHNYYFIGGVTNTNASGVFNPVSSPLTTITPVEASQIDTKIDDGLPITGNVLSVAANAPYLVTEWGGGAGSCSTTATNSYNVGTAVGNTLICMLDVAF